MLNRSVGYLSRTCDGRRVGAPARRSSAPQRLRGLHIAVSVVVPNCFDVEASIVSFKSIGFKESCSQSKPRFSQTDFGDCPVSLLQNGHLSIAVHRLQPEPGYISVARRALPYLGIQRSAARCVVQKIELKSDVFGDTVSESTAGAPSVTTTGAESGWDKAIEIPEEPAMVMHLKEFIIPCGDRDYTHLRAVQQQIFSSSGGHRVRGCADVFKVFTKQMASSSGTADIKASDDDDKHSFIRVIPVNACGIVFHVPCIHQLIKKLQSCEDRLPYEHIGNRAGSAVLSDSQLPADQHIRIDPAATFGLDVRFTDNATEVSSYYNEGSQAVLEHTMAEIQSARVMGGSSDVREKKFGYAGDCWSEVRAMAGRSISRISSSHSNSGSSSCSPTGARTSKLPSIVE